MNKLIAHRGLKENVKENTLESFQKAINNPNYVGFECDVRTTKDKVFVISHNPMIKDSIISLTNYKTLKEKYSIVTLESVLKLKSNKIFLLEIKEHNLDTKSFVKLISKYSHQRIYIMSFFNSVIKKLNTPNHFYHLGVLNYVLNSEENYENYDFICLLEKIATPNLIHYFQEKKIDTFLYGISKLQPLINLYPESYFITDEIL